MCSVKRSGKLATATALVFWWKCIEFCGKKPFTITCVSGGSRIFKKRFQVLQKFSSELVEEQKRVPTVIVNISQHSQLNLASDTILTVPI